MPEESEENIKLLNRRCTRNCEQTGRGRIRINVSGLEFKTYASTLERFPGSDFKITFSKSVFKPRSFPLHKTVVTISIDQIVNSPEGES